MRTSLFHRAKDLRYFFAGLVFGVIFGWIIFIFLFGLKQEEQINKIKEQRAEIKELNEKIELFQRDIAEMNEQNKKQLLIKDIAITFINKEKMKLTELEAFELEKIALHHLNQLLLHKNVDTVSKNKELLISSFENKQFHYDKQQYSFKIRQLYLYTTVELFVDVQLAP